VPSIVEVRPYEADLGVAKASGSLFVTDPMEDSFIRGTLNILGLENVPFEARVAGPPFEVTVLGVTVVIRFDAATRTFIGSAERTGAASRGPTTIVGIE